MDIRILFLLRIIIPSVSFAQTMEKEIHIWWNQKYSSFSTLQWLRFEQRFVRKAANDQLQDGYNFNYRLRYNFSFFIPLKGKELAANVSFIAIINEVFLNFGKRIVYNTFDQNRFFAGFGYMFTSHLNAQLGYMHVFQQESSGASYWFTHAIRFFVFHMLDFRRNKLNHANGQQ